MTKILVTGATGTIGSRVAEALRKDGASVRVGVRTPSKAQDLAARGLEVVALDFDRPETVTAAVQGVDRIFLLTPFIEHFLGQVEAVVNAAKAAGVKFILRMSALGANPDSSDRVTREHGQCEQRVQQSGLGWAILQPTFFQDNFINFQGQVIVATGAFYGCSAGQRTAYIASEDIAASAAAILRSPDAHQGKTYVLTGPNAHTDVEVASIVGDILGRPVNYVDLPPEHFKGGLLQQGAPAWMVEHITHLEGYKSRGEAAATAPSVKTLTGRDPEPLRSFLIRHRDQFPKA